jgi:hypothetical protein
MVIAGDSNACQALQPAAAPATSEHCLFTRLSWWLHMVQAALRLLASMHRQSAAALVVSLAMNRNCIVVHRKSAALSEKPQTMLASTAWIYKAVPPPKKLAEICV